MCLPFSLGSTPWGPWGGWGVGTYQSLLGPWSGVSRACRGCLCAQQLSWRFLSWWAVLGPAAGYLQPLACPSSPTPFPLLRNIKKIKNKTSSHQQCITVVCWLFLFKATVVNNIRLQKRDTHSEETVLEQFSEPWLQEMEGHPQHPCSTFWSPARCWSTCSSRKWTEGLGWAPQGCPSQVDLAPHHRHPQDGHFTVWYAGFLEHRFKGLVDLSEGGPVGGIPLPTCRWDPSQTAHEASLTWGDETFSVESLEINIPILLKHLLLWQVKVTNVTVSYYRRWEFEKILHTGRNMECKIPETGWQQQLHVQTGFYQPASSKCRKLLNPVACFLPYPYFMVIKAQIPHQKRRTN